MLTASELPTILRRMSLLRAVEAKRCNKVELPASFQAPLISSYREWYNERANHDATQYHTCAPPYLWNSTVSISSKPMMHVGLWMKMKDWKNKDENNGI